MAVTDLPHDLGARRLGGARRRPSSSVATLSGLAALLAAVALLSLAVGARDVPLGVVWAALTAHDPAITEHLVVLDLRLPRLLVGLAVGAALGVAGVLMQGLTRNPLADPGLLGVNAGACLAVVLGIYVGGITASGALAGLAFAGAALVSIAVYALGSLGRGAATPVRLALAGTALTSLLLALVQGVLLLSPDTLDAYRFWVVGSLAGTEPAAILALLPALALGTLLALWASASLNAVALGDEAAVALGVRLGLARTATLAAVALLCGGATAAAGPIAFVGLVVPHVARALLGPDLRLGVLAALLLGPILLVGADVLGRVVLPPGEVQVGIMTGLVGGPLFVLVVRRMRVMAP